MKSYTYSQIHLPKTAETQMAQRYKTAMATSRQYNLTTCGLETTKQTHGKETR